MQITRRTLLDGTLLRLDHVVVRPSSVQDRELQQQDCNVVVLPLVGVFAKHDGPRTHVVGTPTDAIFVEAGKPYRLSLPEGIGDESLTLRYPEEALRAPTSSRALLSPAHLLARSLLWRKVRDAARDPLEIEESAVDLLRTVLAAASGRRERGLQPARLKPRIEAVKEAIAIAPERNWTLGELAAVAHISPWHLARAFRSHIGESVHRYVLRARLARTLDAVLDGCDLTAIALDAGFSSHSHFTARFRALFAITPSGLRRTADRATATHLRKIVTAQPRFGN